MPSLHIEQSMEIDVRECRVPDEIGVLTALLHRAYAELAARGLRYVATHQTTETTESRIRAGHCFVAEVNGNLVGTITVRRSNPKSPVSTYREPKTFVVGQYGVEPTMQGKGIGRALHDHAVHFAAQNGAIKMALDTAAPAQHLIALYSKWGYREVERCRWESTNYESVIMEMNVNFRESPHGFKAIAR